MEDSSVRKSSCGIIQSQPLPTCPAELQLLRHEVCSNTDKNMTNYNYLPPTTNTGTEFN